MFSSILTINTLKSLYLWLFQSEMPINKGLQAEKSSKSSNSLDLDIFQFFHKKKCNEFKYLQVIYNYHIIMYNVKNLPRNFFFQNRGGGGPLGSTGSAL